jgi:hypothetical protein
MRACVTEGGGGGGGGGGGSGGGRGVSDIYVHTCYQGISSKNYVILLCSAMTTDFLIRSSKSTRNTMKKQLAHLLAIRSVQLGRPKSVRKIMFCLSFVLQRRLWPPQF